MASMENAFFEVAEKPMSYRQLLLDKTNQLEQKIQLLGKKTVSFLL